MVRPNETGERVPFTIVEADVENGTITLIFQEVGKTTKLLGTFREGDAMLDLVGPLGQPTHIEKFGHCISIGGGYGNAVLLPITRALKAAGNRVTTIIGARTKEMVILEKELGDTSDDLIVCTDDGSYGLKGFVTLELERILKSEDEVDFTLAIGPVPMMAAVCELTKP